MNDKECVFCKMVKGEVKFERIAESNNFFAVNDINPISKGHCLIIPKKHFVTLLDIPNKLGEELLEFTKKTASEIFDRKIGNGFNIIINNFSSAGQFVMHAHIHVIPRKDGDGIRFFVKV